MIFLKKDHFLEFIYENYLEARKND